MRRRRSLNPDYAPDLITHELAHMWFGDQVTLRQWNDIFLNEAYASWAEWGVAERQPIGGPANQRLNATYERTKGERDFWRVTMIDPASRTCSAPSTSAVRWRCRPCATSSATRRSSALAREWAASGGPRSLEEWMVKAQAKTTVDLGPVLPGLDLRRHGARTDRGERLPRLIRTTRTA